MAHFYSSVTGARDSVSTKTGTPNSGIQAHVRGWNVGIRVEGFVHDGKDVFRVSLTSGSNGAHNDKVIGEFDVTSFERKAA